MTLWIDADGFPKRQREIALAAAHRSGIYAVVVSDRPLVINEGPLISQVTVETGDDSTDTYIVNSMVNCDIVITRDILLMERCIERGGITVDDCGNVFTAENIRERVSMRSFMEEFRIAYGETAKKKKPDKKEIEQFANALVRVLGRQE